MLGRGNPAHSHGKGWKMTRRTERGWVTVETAFAALGLGVALVLCAGILALGLAQIRCVDGASEIARQAARGDLAAIAEIESRLPQPHEVHIEQEGTQIRVSVWIQMQPWGQWLPPIPLHAQATAVSERGPR